MSNLIGHITSNLKPQTAKCWPSVVCSFFTPAAVIGGPDTRRQRRGTSGLAEPQGRQAAWPKAEANALQRPRPDAEEGHRGRTPMVAKKERLFVGLIDALQDSRHK